MNEELATIVNDFDNINVIKQIILIGDNGAIRNIELNIEEDEE